MMLQILSALECLYDGQITLLTQMIKLNIRS